jgi:hypothetical protein
MLKNCPICGAPGDDLVFKFECTNPDCQNYVLARDADASWEREPDEDDVQPPWPWAGYDHAVD